MSILPMEIFLTPLPVVYTFHNFEIVNFPFLDGDVPRSSSYAVYSLQLIRFARVYSMVMTSTKGAFVKYIIGLKAFLQQGI